MQPNQHAGGLVRIEEVEAHEEPEHGATKRRNTRAVGDGTWTDDATTVGRGMALALGNDTVKLNVRDARRASLLVEHKVSLQALFGSARGPTIARAAARALNTSTDSFLRTVSRLPAMHVYVASPNQRQHSRGDGPAMVAVRVGPRPTDVKVILKDGQRATLNEAVPAPATSATFILAPDEPTGPRIGPQPASVGTVIQDVGDGEIGSMHRSAKRRHREQVRGRRGVVLPLET